MSRTCTVCSHRERGAIDAALAALEPYRSIAVQYGLSTMALSRHKREAPVVGATEPEVRAEVGRLNAELRQQRQLWMEILAHHFGGAVGSIEAARKLASRFQQPMRVVFVPEARVARCWIVTPADAQTLERLGYQVVDDHAT
jgi:hypothetical protein